MNGLVKVIDQYLSPDSAPVTVVLVRGSYSADQLLDALEQGLAMQEVSALPLTGDELRARLREVSSH
jgi:hypothetical protein